MLSTVFAQLQMPRVLDRFGYRVVFAVGLLFLGLSAFFYAATQTLVSILAATLLRGAGFGIATVLFVALMVELAPPGRRGKRSDYSVSLSRCLPSSVPHWGSGL
jgi:MFS family permease